jgi:WD40 repeat protein
LFISDDDQPGQSDSQFVYVTDDALHKREASQGRALHAQFMVVGQQSLRLKIRHTMAESGAVAAGAPSVAVLDRVCGVKGRLATLCTHEAELDVELSELDVQHAIKLRELEAARLTLEAVHKEAVERVKAKRDVVRAETNAAECELDAAVNAPLSGGRDPTEWLPDELMLMVLERVPFATLWSGACERVCQRWARLMESASIVRHKRDGRWAAYEAGAIKPRTLEGHTNTVWALAVGVDGKIYSGAGDKTIRVWSGESGAHLQTLTVHTDGVTALTVGLDGNIYSGSRDDTVRVWSGASRAHVRILEGHTDWVVALAVGLDGKIYSGSADKTIRVWTSDDGAHLHTLVGHTDLVGALAVGKDGAVYSGSDDTTIRVWSGEDGTHLRTLAGHTNYVASLAVAPDGRVYSGSWDKTIRVWSPVDGAHLHGCAHIRNIMGYKFAPARLCDHALKNSHVLTYHPTTPLTCTSSRVPCGPADVPDGTGASAEDGRSDAVPEQSHRAIHRQRSGHERCVP